MQYVQSSVQAVDAPEHIRERALGGAVGGKPGESAQEARFVLTEDLPLIGVHPAKRKVIKDGRKSGSGVWLEAESRQAEAATDPARDARRE